MVKKRRVQHDERGVSDLVDQYYRDAKRVRPSGSALDLAADIIRETMRWNSEELPKLLSAREELDEARESADEAEKAASVSEERAHDLALELDELRERDRKADHEKENPR